MRSHTQDVLLAMIFGIIVGMFLNSDQVQDYFNKPAVTQTQSK